MKHYITLFILTCILHSQEFNIARIQYGGGGDWYSDPSSLPNLLDYLKTHTPMKKAGAEIKIKLTDDIRKYANDQVTIKNFGQRSAGFNGSREKQYTGVLGECIVYESLDRALPTYNDGSLIEDLIIMKICLIYINGSGKI
jgi:hypothetical protein